MQMAAIASENHNLEGRYQKLVCELGSASLLYTIFNILPEMKLQKGTLPL